MKALVKAFIHISEDAVVGTDLSSKHLYKRVADEAKTRYKGDWMRTGDAYKNCWMQVLREVQQFCSSRKFVESVKHSGWSEDDYFKAAERFYCKQYSV